MKTPCTVIFSALLLTCALGAAKAELDANDDIRDADYKTAHQKCDAYAGDVKAKCIAEAKTRFNK